MIKRRDFLKKSGMIAMAAAFPGIINAEVETTEESAVLNKNKIKVNNFRNYDNEEIELNKNINIFYGENAQGKTNIIEAIFLCSMGRCHPRSLYFLDRLSVTNQRLRRSEI